MVRVKKTFDDKSLLSNTKQKSCVTNLQQKFLDKKTQTFEYENKQNSSAHFCSL